MLRPLILFVLTLASVLLSGAMQLNGGQWPESLDEWLNGWVYAVPLLAILLSHEFGHYFAARYHGVPASLPHFLPLPAISPFGTLGAVIGMPERIRSRRALLDIGAAGPIAGFLVAVPVLLWGLALSHVEPMDQAAMHYVQEGESLLYWLLKRMVLGELPDGHGVWLHPTAFAGWAGLFITMLNLLPSGQLDGGHIAYALWGEVQSKVAAVVRVLVLALLAFNLARFVLPVLLGSSKQSLVTAFANSSFWLVWFAILSWLGPDHPPFDEGTLDRSRQWIAGFCLLLLLLLFLPTPMAQIEVFPGN